MNCHVFNSISMHGPKILLALLIMFTSTSSAFAAPAFVDLRAQQTPIKSQGSRTTCITFASMAALEAAYRRAGYGSLDLSEQFTNHIGKTFWLHPFWDQILALGEDGAESQVGAFGGGGGTGYIAQLATGFRVPEERVMPYRSTEYTEADWPALRNVWNGPYWRKQRNQSDFNLNPRFLPLAAIKAPRYYRVRGVQWVNPRSATEIEEVLASGREVVWDFSVANTAGPIWRPCRSGQANCPGGGHSMILVGYDRRDANPANHYFIAKNSWGPTGTAGAGGFTYISYDYLQYGNSANSITGVNRPQAWPELSFVGRWDLNFDGWKGKLDFYHLPRQMEWVWSQYGVTGIPDRRIGSFYDSNNKAFKVNGSVSGQRVRFFLDGANPNIRWDVLGGREFNYTMVNTTWGEVMAGIHRDPDGRTYGGYAKKGGLLPTGSRAPRPILPASYIGANWSAAFNNTHGMFRFDRIDNSFLTPTERLRYTGLVGRFTSAGRVYTAQALVTTAAPNEIRIRSEALLGSPVSGGLIYGKLLTWEGGVVAGTASTAMGFSNGFVMIRQ